MKSDVHAPKVVVVPLVVPQTRSQPDVVCQVIIDRESMVGEEAVVAIHPRKD